MGAVVERFFHNSVAVIFSDILALHMLLLRTMICCGAILVLQLLSSARADDAPTTAQNGIAAPDSSARQTAPADENDKTDKPTAPAKKKHDPRDLCITEDDAASELVNKRRQIGGRIILDTFLLPTGGSVDVGLDEVFSDTEYYFGALDVGTAKPIILDRPLVTARQPSETDPIIKKGLMRKDRTMLNLQIADVLNAPWT